MKQIELTPFKEIAPATAVDTSTVIKKTYGRYLEEFKDGEVFVHPRAFTIDFSFAQEFATSFMEANPLYLSRPYAQAHGFKDLLVSPLMVFNLALSIGVQNDSEKAMANLGYYNVQFLAPVYPGDTLSARTKVLKVDDKGPEKPGIVHVRTMCFNQSNDVVLQYERKIMINHSNGKPKGDSKPGNPASFFPEADKPVLKLPSLMFPKDFRETTWESTYFDSFKAGQIYIHANGRTITDEHYSWTYRVGNTHPLHYMLWDLGYTEGYHTQPSISGDTVTAITRILSVEDVGDKYGLPAGEVHLQFIGLKNIKAAAAFEKYGADLFIKENDKKKLGKEKLPEKIFEIERKLVIKKKPA